MRKILLLNQAYPNPATNSVGTPFVHDRVKVLKKHFEIVVVKLSKTEGDYDHENIHVKSFTTLEEFRVFSRKFNPDMIVIHFCEPWMYIEGIRGLNKPALIFVHGSEAHAWYRILFILHKKNIRAFLRFMFFNFLTVRNFRRMIADSNKNGNIHFAFVSEWMRRITEADTFRKIKHYSIIHNAIDNHHFSYKQKTVEHRKKILILRSFNSKKYANDISIEAILRLSNKSFFNELEFHIYGQGIWWEKETAKVKHLNNVFLNNKFLNHTQIKDLHAGFGIFLCPTRMDAQGVSMCEAMSSGLVPIASDNTAIPEFVRNGYSGFLTKSAKEIAKRLTQLHEDPDLFLKMSLQAARSIVDISGVDKVMKEEVELIGSCIEKSKL